MSAKNGKALLRSKGVDTSQVVEKRHLVSEFKRPIGLAVEVHDGVAE